MRVSGMMFLVVLGIVTAHLGAQQFQYQSGVITGPTVWSEAVEAFDADGDGRLDVIFTNGNGFSGPSGSLLPTLLMNQGNTPSGHPIFVDQTSSRIPAGFTQQGKGLTTCDVDNDGDTDVVFANAFNNQPRILINDGTGHFGDETSSRFPNLSLSSFGVNSGDLDNDGDIDLVFVDGGPNFLGSPGGMARLLLNDGNGVFTNTPSQMNAVNKVGAMMCNIVDIDRDFDLDVIVDGRSSGTQLYLNDGDANFTYSGSTLPAGSSFVYETDWADLDNDGDVDGAYVSLSSFNEGTATNDLVPSGNLAFSGSTSTLSGTNGNDDNETSFIDADNDGILDLLVASLSGSREKLYLNSGAMTSGSFVYQSSAFPALSDSTLDLTIGDFDGDGDYDVVTAQGESGSYLNRYYSNTGPTDTTPPHIVAVEVPGNPLPASAFPGAGLPIRAWVQDSTYDNGKIWLTATLHVTLSKLGTTQSSSGAMQYVGGGMFRGLIQPGAWSPGLVGTQVSYHVEATDAAGNVTSSPPTVVTVCGTGNYGAVSAVNNLSIAASPPNPVIGANLTISLGGGPANQTGAVAVSVGRANIPFLGGTILVDPVPATIIPVSSDGSGTAATTIQVPAIPSLVGFVGTMQGLLFDPAQPQSWSFSNGLEAGICGFLSGPPVPQSVSPSAAAPGNSVVITGTDFQMGLGLNVGGIPVMPSSVTPTSVSFVMPPGVPCDSTLDVINPDGQSGSLPFNLSPTIVNSVFSSGPAAGGMNFIIVGTGFVQGTMSVTIGGVPATITNSGATVLFVQTPPGTSGTATVVVTAPSGCTATTTYTYL